VLHGGDLCYAIALAQPTGGPRAAYGLINRWLQRSFEQLGNPLRPGSTGQDRQLINCFASGTAADLLGTKGEKRIGSAQLWRRGLLLQHGSIQLNPDPGLWRMLFDQEAPQALGLALGDTIEAELQTEAQAWLFGTQPEELPLPAITSGNDATLWAIGAKAMPIG
jgi:lipoate-protein ligase A